MSTIAVAPIKENTINNDLWHLRFGIGPVAHFVQYTPDEILIEILSRANKLNENTIAKIEEVFGESKKDPSVLIRLFSEENSLLAAFSLLVKGKISVQQYQMASELVAISHEFSNHDIANSDTFCSTE